MLKDYAPANLCEKFIFKSIYDTQQSEIDNLNNAVDDIVNQCFVETATWGLRYWEEMLAITTDETKAYEFRRSVIKAKLRGAGTITVSLIKNVAESFSNSEVEVFENVQPYTFEIKFTGPKGIPPNLDDLKNSINDIKPAHLAVTYSFTYNTWSMVSNKKWADVSNKTWSQLATL